MTAPDLDLDAIEELAKRATPGPWLAVLGEDQPVCYYRALIGLAANKDDAGYVSVVASDPSQEAVERVRQNANHIASANPQTALSLAAHIRFLESEVRALCLGCGMAANSQRPCDAHAARMMTKAEAPR